MNSIGQASKESGVGIETIRYYEREGIIPKANRTSNGRRVYAREDISRLKFIKRFRSLGFPISDISSLLMFAFSPQNTCQEASIIGERNLEIVRQKIDKLQHVERVLGDLVKQCSRNPAKCPMLDVLGKG
ncbi:MAG: MerR family transcriptional regulator [Rhizobiaceae bacterium]